MSSALLLRKVVAVCLVIILIITVVFPRPVQGQLTQVQLADLLKTIYEIIKTVWEKCSTRSRNSLSGSTSSTNWFS